MQDKVISPIERWLLTGQAMFAETAFWLTTMLLWVPILILTSVFYPSSWAWAAAVGLSVLSWWWSQPSIEVEGFKVLRADAPLLYKELDQLAKALDAPQIDEVLLDGSLNAGAYESRGFLSMIGVRRTLILGLPLLRLLNKAEARAVIAHELGHFSGRHGRLGHWIYLVRAKWMAYLYLADAEDSTIASLRQVLADHFLPGFLTRSAAWSRRCEFEADAVAASVPGAGRELVSALTKLLVVHSTSKTDLARHLAHLQKATPEAPDNYWEIVATLAASKVAKPFDVSSVSSLAEPSHPDNTHPPVNERALAIGVDVQVPDWTSFEAAGEALLGSDWAKLYRQSNENWRSRNKNTWRLQHLRMASIGDADDTTLAPEHRTLRQLTRDDEAQWSDDTLNALRDFEGAHVGFPLASYVLGVALLNRGLSEGARFVRKAIKADPHLAIRGYEVLLGFYYLHGRPSQVRYCHEQLQLASDRIQRPSASIGSILLNSKLSSLEGPTAKLLRRSLSGEEDIDGLWVVRTELSGVNDSKHAACVVVVRMNPLVSAHVPSKEQSLLRDVTSCVESLISPRDLVISTLWFTTEAVNPRLVVKLQSTEGAEIFAPLTPIRNDILKTDLA
ncbi:M48 family metalloprotease [Hydrogenophaga sp. RWCD_12]|uniref:M48 family metallopeptidase n=1 Tax=Hydrogenophaga sp. RWCD_12 TaxID=3391190 RepID=UPI0039851725